MSARDGVSAVPSGPMTVMPSSLSKDGTEGFGTIPSVLVKSRNGADGKGQTRSELNINKGVQARGYSRFH